MISEKVQHTSTGEMSWITALVITSIVGISLAQEAGPCPPTSSTAQFDYGQALCMSILFYEAERSGALPDDMRFDWRGDSAMNDGQDNGVDLTGGYYDAGDHVKFGLPLAGSLTVLAWGLLSFTEGYEATGQVEYAKAAVKWGTDYLLKHTLHQPNSFVGDGNLDHTFWGRPEEMTMDRPSYLLCAEAPGSEVVGESAAALAAASIVFADSDPGYSSECLAAAEELFSFADQFRDNYHNSIPEDQGGFYQSYSYGDELTWAAIWLYKATQDESYATKAKELWDEFGMDYVANNFSWDNKNPGVQVLFAEEFGDETYISIVKDFIDAVKGYPHTPLGLVIINEWGTLRHAMNEAFLAFKIADLGVDPEENRAWAAQQVDYALGSTGRSFVVGFGTNPPLRPHHRSSSCPDLPEVCDGGWALNQEGPNPQTLYGALVGGPDEFDGYTDDRQDYVHNEVACDYNAAFTGALAAMVIIS